MKTLIYQVYIGNQLKLYDVCIKSVETYCKKYNIDHIVQREPILNIIPDLKTTKRNPSAWNKYGCLPIYEKENAFSYLSEYDKIAIIDSDIYIRKDSPNIFDELNDPFVFGGVLEREMPLTKQYFHKIKTYSQEQYGSLNDVKWNVNIHGYDFMNMGLMIFTKSLLPFLKNQTPKEFINRPEFKDFVDGKDFYKWSTDQTLLNYWIKKELIPVKYLNWRWNSLYKGIEDIYLRDSYFIHFFLKDHLPFNGENIEQLLILQNLL